MKIATICVRYSELRSTGYPSYSNKRIEVELGAELEHGEIPRVCKERLLDLAKKEVQLAFGDIKADEMEKAYE
jgi:hypothetical protein